MMDADTPLAPSAAIWSAIAALEAHNAKLRQRIDDMEARIAALERRVAALEAAGALPGQDNGD